MPRGWRNCSSLLPSYKKPKGTSLVFWGGCKFHLIYYLSKFAGHLRNHREIRLFMSGQVGGKLILKSTQGTFLQRPISLPARGAESRLWANPKRHPSILQRVTCKGRGRRARLVHCGSQDPRKEGPEHVLPPPACSCLTALVILSVLCTCQACSQLAQGSGRRRAPICG